MLDRETRQIAGAKARDYDLPEANVLAVIDVESGGQVFVTVGGKPFPLILFEPHVLYRLVSGAVRERLVAEKLASPKWNKKLYAKTQAGRWVQVKRAAEIAGNVAYEAVSYGVGQVLGMHWKVLGFASVQAMIDVAFSGVGGQVDVMLRFIKVNGLDDELRDGRWAAFARGYNGAGYKANAYDTKIEAAALRYGGDTPAPDGLLRMGSKGARVRELQALLVRAGHQVKVDGDFGPSTRDALKAFQTANGLTSDGIYGPQTEHVLGALRQGAGDKPGAQKPMEVKEVLQGLGAAIGGPVVIDQAKGIVEDATSQLQQYDALSPLIGYGLAALSVLAVGLTVAGIGYAVWGWIKSKKTVEA